VIRGRANCDDWSTPFQFETEQYNFSVACGADASKLTATVALLQQGTEITRWTTFFGLVVMAHRPQVG
jgi:hypothetical protein